MGAIVEQSQYWLQLGIAGAALFLVLICVIAVFWITKSIVGGMERIANQFAHLTKEITVLMSNNETQNKNILSKSDGINNSVRRIHDRVDDISKDITEVKTIVERCDYRGLRKNNNEIHFQNTSGDTM